MAFVERTLDHVITHRFLSKQEEGFFLCVCVCVCGFSGNPGNSGLFLCIIYFLFRGNTFAPPHTHLSLEMHGMDAEKLMLGLPPLHRQREQFYKYLNSGYV